MKTRSSREHIDVWVTDTWDQLVGTLGDQTLQMPPGLPNVSQMLPKSLERLPRSCRRFSGISRTSPKQAQDPSCISQECRRRPPESLARRNQKKYLEDEDEANR